jgi:hypothetical protein
MVSDSQPSKSSSELEKPCAPRKTGRTLNNLERKHGLTRYNERLDVELFRRRMTPGME